MYAPYVTPLEYEKYYADVEGMEEDPELSLRLKRVSRHIDTLTYNRIVARGIENLTQYQQEIIKEVACRQARFEYENQDILETILSSYSLNGVSMTIDDGWKLHIEQGVVMKSEDYALLKQTGLCCRMLGV